MWSSEPSVFQFCDQLTSDKVKMLLMSMCVVRQWIKFVHLFERVRTCQTSVVPSHANTELIFFPTKLYFSLIPPERRYSYAWTEINWILRLSFYVKGNKLKFDTPNWYCNSSLHYQVLPNHIWKLMLMNIPATASQFIYTHCTPRLLTYQVSDRM